MSTRARRRKQKDVPSIKSQHFDLAHILPVTENQEDVFECYENEENLFLLGCAGTGKTFISVYLAMKEILDMLTYRRKLVIIRSTQASKAQGFLPGTAEQKAAVFELPYKAICSELFHRDDAYEILKQKGIIEFQTTAYLRGTTLEDSIIMLDEAQNLTYQEIRTVVTRPGERSRLIVCGDTRQDDLTSSRYNEESGLSTIIKIFEEMNCMECVTFGVEDIVRSGFVKEFITMEYKLGVGY